MAIMDPLDSNLVGDSSNLPVFRRIIIEFCSQDNDFDRKEALVEGNSGVGVQRTRPVAKLFFYLHLGKHVRQRRSSDGIAADGLLQGKTRLMGVALLFSNLKDFSLSLSEPSVLSVRPRPPILKS